MPATNEGANKLAILAGGGPAPGINAVISAATIQAALRGVPVLGVQDGFEWLSKGDTSKVRALTPRDVSRIHFQGGSVLGISRSNPTKSEALLENVVNALTSLGVDKLVTIGGDDTAFSSSKIEAKAAGRLRVVHVPKTIDNDLDLPGEAFTFGFQTARHVGTDIVKALMADAKTTKRWYFAVAMGRKAGHLALGIGKAAGATNVIIPEEYAGSTLRLATLVDALAAMIIKRRAFGRGDGVVVLAEGLVELLDERDLEDLPEVERDAHGHLRIAEVNFGDLLKSKVRARLKELGVEVTIGTKNIGYELRCADPIAIDMEYTRDLGYCATKFLCDGGSGAMVSINDGRFEPIPFAKLLDPKTGKSKVRMVDLASAKYSIANAYMIRLRASDLADPTELERLAATAEMEPAAFRAQFEHVAQKG